VGWHFCIIALLYYDCSFKYHKLKSKEVLCFLICDIFGKTEYQKDLFLPHLRRPTPPSPSMTLAGGGGGGAWVSKVSGLKGKRRLLLKMGWTFHVFRSLSSYDPWLIFWMMWNGPLCLPSSLCISLVVFRFSEETQTR
jgi:hypothetical protein